ncbi:MULTISPECIES: hypothetical protein [unclassified Bradyrhizobium]|uniref:hypothetical protein n=1 Tax=unclassified Bradyrhizobium TaxID=2631580 RepID=UPI00247AC824|nr:MULTISPECIES: hypothetical protein [unclassified Bradyrhizobium]WGS18245.1 hypothetical protein MTX22_27165 [Bradyrhizobium sp. ISRA463]WGS25061.1 hypothetical protein MTX19_24790 [Bradyrhizobium sp. ISRA464]
MLGIVLASGICGLLLGRYFKVYVCLPAMLLVIPAAYLVGHMHGLTMGIVAFISSVVAMQGCFLIGATVRIFIENFEPRRAPSEDFI